MLLAAALVARVLHQPLPVVKAMPLPELFTWAKIAAEMDGKAFE
ncbi:hypothetical protein ACEQ38_01035 [Ralstonia syzygii subsp. celebesensis]|uniref:Uncharacterized protein n=1 Tax=blood disease bacterium R229 TaxID=741978 RepID=G2ZPY0_9RALS|nr:MULTISPECIES: hypothetical protein [Ralstonia solanacearum species complex]CCA81095.1 conserved hypothetical protein [blood disease bacterium R229]